LSVAAADFDQDGRLDLVVTNSSTNSVGVLLGRGDGTLSTQVDYPTGTYPRSVATGDFDRDGSLDLAVGDAGDPVHAISILLGRGDGTFAARVDYPLEGYPWSVAVGDLDGDGRLDLAVANANEGMVGVLLGHGDGTFAAQLDYPVAGQAADVGIGDLDGDGRLDLAAAVGGGAPDMPGWVSVLLNTCFSAPEPSGSGGAGGSGAGGAANGGSGTGGAGGTTPVPVCETATALPATGAACISPGRSLCLPNGDRCFCARGIWICNTDCTRDYPTAPSPGSACSSGAVCTYSGAASCLCLESQWSCLGVNGCPAQMPYTGGSCSGLVGLECDYPNASPGSHYVCSCGEPGAGTSPSWLCYGLGTGCPATQPPYSLTTPCPGRRFCQYGDTYCQCLGNGMPWICGPGAFLSWGCYPNPNACF
jgi:hypothetical protein